jgi:hypothetical protein
MSASDGETPSSGGPGAKPPGADGSPAPLAFRMEDITLWMIGRAAKMPGEQKFLVGDKLVETCLDITCALVEATHVRDKLALLAQASRGRTRARFLSAEQLAHFERAPARIGRMPHPSRPNPRHLRARPPPRRAHRIPRPRGVERVAHHELRALAAR